MTQAACDSRIAGLALYPTRESKQVSVSRRIGEGNPAKDRDHRISVGISCNLELPC